MRVRLGGAGGFLLGSPREFIQGQPEAVGFLRRSSLGSLLGRS